MIITLLWITFIIMLLESKQTKKLLSLQGRIKIERWKKV
jgi:hypothetical protein